MDGLKSFVFNALLAENSLDQLSEQGISVRGNEPIPPTIGVDEMAFSPTIQYDAQRMASVFMAYFCIENSIRELITERLITRVGTDWWDKAVPAKIKTAVRSLKEKELRNKYLAQRSSTPIGYTLFGHLEQIIIANWQQFSDLFPEQAWITSRFKDLETSRNIIMHTGTLPQIEIDRIESIARDWLRQVG
jgi:HEPN superfamily Swt1-like protein